MTIKQIIDEADGLKPNAFTSGQKFGWLNTLEGRVQTDVFLTPPGEAKKYTSYDTDQGETLMAPHPFDELYVWWLCAMIDLYNGETNRYMNTMQVFNSLMSDFTCWFASSYEPAQVGPLEYTLLGTVNYDAESGEAVALYTLPANAMLLRVLCVVNTPFDSSVSDVLVLGTAADDDALMADGDIDESTEGTYTKAAYLTGGAAGTKLYAKLTKTGESAAQGSAVFYGRVLEMRR